MITEAISAYAEASNALIYGSMAAYAIALVAFSVDLARLADRTPPKRRKLAGIGQALMWAAFLMHLGGVVSRGLAVGRVPWANMYEFAITATMIATAVYLSLQYKRDMRFLGAPTAGIVLLILGAGVSLFYVDARDLAPALQNYWLIIHVSVATVSVGVLTLAFLVSVLQLLVDHQDRKNVSAKVEVSATVGGKNGGVVTETVPESGKKTPSTGFGRLLSRTGSAQQLEGFAFRLNAVGFVTWTFTLIAGSIWAEHAWGRFWGWDAKEVWTFIIWVVYAAYLHARTTRGWAGARAAWFAIAGYVCVIFNYTIVNMFFNSIHAYSGIG